nr:hypothetical protein [uncultured Roseovarius sp.]
MPYKDGALWRDAAANHRLAKSNKVTIHRLGGASLVKVANLELLIKRTGAKQGTSWGAAIVALLFLA